MASDLATGTEIAGRYRLVERLPDGPCGERWRATDAQGPDGRLTLIRALRAVPDAQRARALEVLRRFGHPHAVPVRDAGARDGGVYVVAAVPEGRALRGWLAEMNAQGTRLSLPNARALVDQVAQVVAAAHRGVDGTPLVHGAPLAASVFVERRGEVQFVAFLDDVGVVALGARGASALLPGARDDGPSAPDDVYGIGALLAEVLTGEAFAPGADLHGACDRLAHARPEADPSLWNVVRACVAPSPSDRPESVVRVRELLRQAVWTPREVRAAPEPPPPPPPPPPAAPAAPERARIMVVSAPPATTPAMTPRPQSAPLPAPEVPPPSAPAPAPAVTPIPSAVVAPIPPAVVAPVATAVTAPVVREAPARSRNATVMMDGAPVENPAPRSGEQVAAQSATLRARRALLTFGKRLGAPPAARAATPSAPPSVAPTPDVAAPASPPLAGTLDAPRAGLPATKLAPSRHATLLPVGGPDAPRPSNAPIVAAPHVSPDEAFETRRVPRQSSTPPRAPPSSAPPARASGGDFFPDVMTEPALVLPTTPPAVARTPAPAGATLAQPTSLPPPSVEAFRKTPRSAGNLVWWILALVVGVLVMLAVAVSSTAR